MSRECACYMLTTETNVSGHKFGNNQKLFNNDQVFILFSSDKQLTSKQMYDLYLGTEGHIHLTWNRNWSLEDTYGEQLKRASTTWTIRNEKEKKNENQAKNKTIIMGEIFRLIEWKVCIQFWTWKQKMNTKTKSQVPWNTINLNINLCYKNVFLLSKRDWTKFKYSWRVTSNQSTN